VLGDILNGGEGVYYGLNIRDLLNMAVVRFYQWS